MATVNVGDPLAEGPAYVMVGVMDGVIEGLAVTVGLHSTWTVVVSVLLVPNPSAKGADALTLKPVSPQGPNRYTHEKDELEPAETAALAGEGPEIRYGEAPFKKPMFGLTSTVNVALLKAVIWNVMCCCEVAVLDE